MSRGLDLGINNLPKKLEKDSENNLQAPYCHGRAMELKAVVVPTYYFQCKACGKVRWLW